jgi:Bacteriophage T4-like portal protein (Gp20)
MPNPTLKPFDDEVLDVKKQSLYARLKRLFSTDVIVRNVGGKQLKIKDTDSIMYATDRNSLRDRFNRIRSTAYNAYTRDFALSYQSARMDLFRDYDTMDMDPILSSALDIYADECLTYNEMGKMLTVHSNNNNVKQILDNLFNDILNIQFNMWSWTRNMCKYGDFYLKLYVTPEYGIYMVEPISSYNVERIENADPYNKRYVKFQLRPTDTAQAEMLENYEMAHFRLMSDSNFMPYGKSLLEGGRRVWKQLSLMEDAMLIHRIMRAPEKRIFYTDIGNIPPAEVDTFMQKMMDKMKKVPYMDEQSGEYNLRFNLQNMIEDYYIPVRGGDSGTKIDTLGGMEWTGTDDIEYLRNKLMAALKIPKAFLGYEEGISGKATLASEDVRFARTIQRIQRILCSELTKIAIVHLYAQGYRDESLVDFELELTNPSTIFEKEKIEIWSDKVSVATDMVENKFFSFDWIYKNVFNMSEDDIKIVKEQVVEDAKQRYRFTSIEEDGDDPAKPFKKIGGKGGKDSEDSGGKHGGGGGLGDLDDLDDLDDLEKGNKEGGKEGGPEGGPEDIGGKGGPEDLVKEIKVVDNRDRSDRDTSNRDQSGEHSARKQHPFGEDPLGSNELSSNSNKNSEGKKKSEIGHNYEGGSPLRLKEQVVKENPQTVNTVLFDSLAKFMGKTQKDTKKELIKESRATGSKSLLDENNILE